MAGMAGAEGLGDFASAIGVRTQESAIIQELEAGSEEAYAWLVGEFNQPVYSGVYRIAIHEASNRRRWWFRHKAKETSMEHGDPESELYSFQSAESALVDPH